MQDKDVVAELISIIEEPQEEVRLERRVNHVGKRLKTGRGLRITTQIRYYGMNYIIMDLGSDFNIMTRKKGKNMGKLRLVWSPVQL